MSSNQRIKVGDWITVTNETVLKKNPTLRGEIFKVRQIVGPPRFSKQVQILATGPFGTPLLMWVLVRRVTKVDIRRD